MGLRFGIIIGLLGCSILPDFAQAKNYSKLKTPAIADDEFRPGDGKAIQDDIILNQSLITPSTVYLQAPFFLQIRKSGNARVSIDSTTALYTVTTKKGLNVHCTYDDAYFVSPKIGKPIETQVCFMDEDNDNRFERIFFSEKGKLDIPKFVHNLLIEWKKPFDPVGYSKGEASPNVILPSRIRLDKIRDSELNFDMEFKSEDGNWQSYARQTIMVPTDVKFPQEIDIFGARVEISSVKDGMLDYRVKSGVLQDLTLAVSIKMSSSGAKFMEFVEPIN